MMAYFYLFELKLKSIDRVLNIYGLDYDEKYRSLLVGVVLWPRLLCLGFYWKASLFPLVKKYILFFIECWYLKLVSCSVFIKTLIFKSIEQIKCETFQTENQGRMDPIDAKSDDDSWMVGGRGRGGDGQQSRQKGESNHFCAVATNKSRTHETRQHTASSSCSPGQLPATEL